MSRHRTPIFLSVTLSALGTTLVLYAPAGCSSGPRVSSERRQLEGRECVSCHDDYLRRSSAHLAIEESCEACHVPHGLVGVLRLKSAEPEMCVECHSEIAHAAEGETAHPPEGAACSSCHDPHEEAQTTSCMSCHPGLTAAVSGHDGLPGGCLACHDPHGAASGKMLTAGEPAVCVQCHSLDDGALASAHQEIPLDGARCSECHAGHGGTDLAAGLRLASHPTTREGRCEACHEPASTSLRMDAGQACRSCHQEVSGDHAESIHPGLTDASCLDCHSPHAGPAHPVLRDLPGALCTTCHEGVTNIPGAHQPVAAGDCLSCHSGHGTEEEALLVREPGRELCSECHADSVDRYDSLPNAHAPLDACEMCHSGHGTGKSNLLVADGVELCGSCHADSMTAFQAGEMHLPVAAGACTECHDAHSSPHPQLLSSPSGDLCLSCHQEYHTDALGPVIHDPIKWKLCLSCHDAHSSTHGNLLSGPARQVCVSCHADTHRSVQAASVEHPPVNDGNCLACHESHGGVIEGLMSAEPTALCVTCHADVVQDALDHSTTHPPVTAGQCLKCHTGHPSNFPSLTRTATSAFCADCHSVDSDSFRRDHLGLPGTDMDCYACHDSHGGVRGMLHPELHEPFAKGDCSDCHVMK